MVESKLTYEECRRQRLEENKKRMEELNLNKLADALKSSSPKPSPMKQMKRSRPLLDISSISVRRSSRVADMPPPNYKEVPIEPLPGVRRTYSYQRRDLLNRVYASHEERQYAINRAEELQASLDSTNPSFVKPMLQSHVTGGFWLGLPNHFCKSNLPHHDVMITLVDEDGDEFPTKYLAEKTGLSGGWRGFSMEHQLVDGDAVVFHLTKPTEFKVYIIRAYNLEDRADNNENLDVSQPEKSGKRTRSANNLKDKAGNNENSNVSQPETSGKRTRSANNLKDKADNNENSNGSQPEKSGKRTRSAKNLKDKADNNENSNVSQPEKSGGRTRSTRKK